MHRSKHRFAWPALFIGPHLILFVLFFLIPVLFGLYVSFTKWDLYSTPQWVGLKNYATILFDHGSVWHQQFTQGLGNTLIFVIFTTPLLIIVPLFIAVLLNLKPRFAKVFQSIFYLPNLFAISAVMIIWNFLFSQSYGPLKSVFHFHTDVLSNQPWAWIAIIVVTVWWIIGGNMIIYQAALNGVSKEVLESASLDGASAWQKFWNIYLPDIRFQLLFTTVTTTIAQFNVYGQPLMLTGGGPNNSTRVLLMDIQNNTFGQGISSAGVSSAMAILLGLVIMLVSVVQFFLMRKDS
ncbi:carbohydrate ABC transporter permease [Lacticaseibacillus jixiensis]|uniref:carbohydrate ABC transporter permease n=1 Tax=Lacticaseibacillus jixiensis TaxID=3231926 RepID=UPI0036F28147